jgi:hypothetical protein
MISTAARRPSEGDYDAQAHQRHRVLLAAAPSTAGGSASSSILAPPGEVGVYPRAGAQQAPTREGAGAD